MKACSVLLLFWVLLVLPQPLLATMDLPGEDQAGSVEERRIMVSLEEEYDKLSERQAELDRREMQLKTLAGEVDKKLAAMQELRTELVSLLDRKQQEEGRRVGELSGIYEKMEPAKAAHLIKSLDKQLAIELLLGIKKKVAGEILNNLDPNFATELTEAFTKIPVEDKTGY
jgi:flagellar motility protein MotE (MotC chaperone)